MRVRLGMKVRNISLLGIWRMARLMWMATRATMPWRTLAKRSEGTRVKSSGHDCHSKSMNLQFKKEMSTRPLDVQYIAIGVQHAWRPKDAATPIKQRTPRATNLRCGSTTASWLTRSRRRCRFWWHVAGDSRAMAARPYPRKAQINMRLHSWWDGSGDSDTNV